MAADYDGSLQGNDINPGSVVASSSVSVTVTSAPPVVPPPTGGLTFAATAGAMSGPFVVKGGAISQPTYTSLAASGRAVYSFAVATAGDYTLVASVDAPDIGANSVFLNIDGEPTDPLMIWDIPVTRGVASRTVSWRGNGTDGTNQYAPKVFTLAAGPHQLMVRGREGNCQLSSFAVSPVGTTTPAPTRQTLAATSGTISAPFLIASNVIYQSAYTTAAAGGRAVYTVTIPVSGDYLVSARIHAPNLSADSVYLTFDGEPTDPAMIWDVPLTTGFEERRVAWRGTGNGATKVFNLMAGTHTLVVRGREANCLVSSWTITPASTLTLPFQTLDLGSVTLTGGAGVTNGTWTVSGRGGLNGTADSFRYAYQALNGDGLIMARLASLTNFVSGGQAGLMIRETLTGGSRYALLSLTPNGAFWQNRTATGGSTVSTTLPNLGATPGAWIRLVRTGDLLAGSYSNDGTTWTPAGSVTLAMAANIQIGLAVASGSTNAVGTAAFSNVTVTP